MITEIPQYCLRAYALFFSRHGSKEPFRQSELDWIVSQSMRKKIFHVLLKSGWISKDSRNSYKCVEPEIVMKELVSFKVQDLIKEAKKPYCFTNLSAVEIWSDYSYVQRGIDKSPYFIKILKKDLKYWKGFFNERNIPNYVNEGTTIGEYVILIPSDKIQSVSRNDLEVEPLKKTLLIAKENDMFSYAYKYMRSKYGKSSA